MIVQTDYALSRIKALKTTIFMVSIGKTAAMSAYNARFAWPISREYASSRILFARWILIREGLGLCLLENQSQIFPVFGASMAGFAVVPVGSADFEQRSRGI